MKKNTSLLLFMVLIIAALSSCQKEDVKDEAALDHLATRILGTWDIQVEILRFGSSTSADLHHQNVTEINFREGGTGSIGEGGLEKITWTIINEKEVKVVTESISGSISVEQNFDVIENEPDFQHWNDTRVFDEGDDTITFMYIWKMNKQ